MASRSINRNIVILRGLQCGAGVFRSLRYGLVAALFAVAAFGQCTFTVSPSLQVYTDSLGYIDQAHDPLVIQVTASAQTCSWTADATDGFATVTGSHTGTGNGSVTYSMPTNTTGSPQTVTLNIAGNAVTLTQDFTATAFSDVLPNTPGLNEVFFDGINLLLANKITSGTSPTTYSPNANVTRDQMAVFIVRTILGGGPTVDNFSYSTTPYFTDVPPTYLYFKWIQKMRDLGITAGTSATTYGPQLPVTRDQMAIFIVRARLGVNVAFNPPALQQFTDVAPTGPEQNYYSYIQELKEIGLTAGCTTTTYCPTEAVTRGQMAIFLMRAGFNTLLSAGSPLLTQLSPTSGAPGAAPFTLTVKGINTHFQQGVTTVLSAGGATFGTPSVTDATDLTVTMTIPGGTPLGQISITAETLLQPGVYEDASAPNIFTVGTGDPPPTITSFVPASGPVGTAVTITGTTLVSSLLTPVTVQVPLQGGGMTPAPVTSASSTSVTFVVPSTAASGTFQLLSFGGNVTSATPFTVTPSSTYTLTASPSTGNVIAGQSTTFTVSLASTTGFTGLATLSVLGLPSGLTAAFSPTQITAGQQSTLTITAPSNQGTNTATITITGAATVDGLAESVSATPTLNVTPVTTSFLGRTVVDNTSNTSLVGVTVTMVGQDGSGHTTTCTGSTTSDGSGNFALTNLPPACLGPQLIGFVGTTVTSPAGTFAGLQLVFTLVSNTVVVSPVLVHLPQISTAETFMVMQNDPVNQTYAFKTIPGLSVTVYAGTVLTEQDGTMPNPFPLAAVQVPVDRLPDVMPPTTAAVVPFIVAFQPAETNSTIEVAVSFPNTLNTPPGTDVPLMTLNPMLGRVVPYGTGTVSSDGTTIVPDIDPASGSKQYRYGLVHFDWHGPAGGPPNGNNPGPCNGKGWGGDPVDLSSGLFTEYSTDMELRGLFPIQIKRVMRNGGIPGNIPLPFGTGADFDYDIRLDLVSTYGAPVINLIMPDGNRYPFSLQANGTLINSTICNMQGAVMTAFPNNTTTIAFPDGSSMSFFPGIVPTGSLLSSWTDKNGNTLTFTRGGAPYLLTTLTNASGLSLNFTYSGYTITQISDPIGRTVNYTYNGAGYLATVTHSDGAKWSYTYDSNNNIVTETNPRGVVTVTNTYDANSRVVQQKQADGSGVNFAYTLVNPLVPTSPVQQTVFTDENGHSWTHRFSPLGYTLSVVDPMGNERDFTRALGTNFLLSIGGNGQCGSLCGKPELGNMTFTYDTIGNLLSVTNAAGGTEQFTYQPGTNFLTSVTNAVLQTWTYAYDAKGNLISQTDPVGGQKKFTYGTGGLLASAADELGNTATYAYNTNGEMISMTDPDGHVTQFSYDGVGRVVAIKDPKGQVTQLQYDTKDRLTSQTLPNGSVVSFTYDLLGALTSVTDPRGGVTTWTYDGFERATSVKDADGNVTAYTYDSVGNLLTMTDRKGQKTTYSYDSLNRRNLDTFSDGASVARQFDAAGRVLQETDSVAGVFKNTYDVAGNLAQQTTPFGSLTYTRNAVFATASKQVTGQPTVNYTYDPRGYVSQISMGANTVQFTYDARGRATGITRSNGVTSTNVFDAVGNVTAVTHANGGTQLDNEAVTYDPLNNVASASKVIAQALTTQPAAATYDAAGRVTTFGSRTVTSDANGSRTADAGSAGTTTYTWDARNRLTGMTVPASGGTPAFTVTYEYDPEGNLIQRRAVSANPDSAGGDVITQYLLDENSNVVYQGTVGGEQLNMLTGNALDAQFGIVGTAGTLGFALQDYLGNIVGNTNSLGALAGSDDYEPFGQTTQTGSAYPFAFQGRIQAVSNLYNFRARYYDPTTGSFISEDPAGIRSDFNFYRYSGNNPATYGDPTGQAWNGISWGGQFSAEAEGGIGTGASGTASYGGGTFIGGSGISGGAWASDGGFVGGPNAGYNYATPGNGGGGASSGAGSGCGGVVLGASASAGFGGWISNAGQASDLNGTFNQFNFNAGIGPVKGGLSVAWSGGNFNPFNGQSLSFPTVIIGISPPAAGLTAGISASFYKTNTFGTTGSPPSW